MAAPTDVPEPAGVHAEPAQIPELTDEQLAFLESIFDLARDGNTELLIRNIEAGVPVNLTNARGDSLLILAAYHGHLDTVRALLGAGADSSRLNAMGQTALSAATFRNDAPIVSALLTYGADPTHGPQNAVSVAKHFELPEMQALFESAAE